MPPRPGRVLPFPPPRGSAPPGGPPPRRRPTGLVATMSIDASEVARLVARDLADEWVKGLIADHQRRSGPPASSAPVPCGAPRRHPPHAPCRSRSIPDTWVTDYSGDIGNTFGLNGFSMGSSLHVS